MTDDELKVGKILEDGGAHQRLHGDALLRDEVVVEGLPRVETPSRVDNARRVQLHHLLVEGIPVVVTHPWGLAVALAGVRVHDAADEAQLFDAALQLFEGDGGALARALRQPGDASHEVGTEFDGKGNRVVGGLNEVVDDLFGLLSVHHGEGPRRNEGHAGAHLRQERLMALAGEGGVGDALLGDVGVTLAVEAPAADEERLIRRQFVARDGRGYERR